MFSLTPWKKRRGGELTATVPETADDWFAPLTRFREEFDTWMKQFFSEPFGEGAVRRFEPPWMSNWLGARDLEWEESDREYVLKAQIPGFEPDDIDVKMTGDVLTIRAERREEKEEGGERHYHVGRFFRSMSLPAGVRRDDIEARYHSGVLEIRLPKTEEARGKRIEVKSA